MSRSNSDIFCSSLHSCVIRQKKKKKGKKLDVKIKAGLLETEKSDVIKSKTEIGWILKRRTN